MSYEWKDFIPVVGLGHYMERNELSRLETDEDYYMATFHVAMVAGMAFAEPILKMAYSGVVRGIEQLLK